MFTFADRIKEISTTTGTGDFTLAGPVARFFAFSSALQVGDFVPYLIEHQTTTEFEFGFGQYSAPNTLHRAPGGLGVLGSSSGGLVNFSPGNKIVSLVPMAMLASLSDLARARLSAGPFRTYFGDGSDGDLTVSSGTVVLQGRRQYRRLVVSGGTLVTNGYDVRAWITEVAGVIRNSGGDGVNATGGTGPGQAVIGGTDTQAGKTGGGQTADGTAGGSVGGVGGAGGAGGNGGESPEVSTAGTGAPGGSVTGSYSVSGIDSYYAANGNIVAGFAAIEGGAAGGSGGGGDPGDTVGGAGGGSGAGGGVVLLSTAILIGRGGVIHANGGRGGNGSAGNDVGIGEDGAGGGGGGGGGGGWVNVAYLVKTGSSVSFAAHGGAGGNGGPGGGPGRGGDGGGGGNGGRVTVINLMTGAITDQTGTAGKAGNPAPGAGTQAGGSGGSGGTCSVSV